MRVISTCLALLACGCGAIERPTYEDMMVEQLDAAIAKSGPGNLEKLINSGDTWLVE